MTERFAEMNPAGYYLRDTISVRIYYVGLAVLWTFLAAGAASTALYAGAHVGANVIEAARAGSPFEAMKATQIWGLAFGTLLAAIVAAGLGALAWQRFAAAVRLVPARYGPAPTSSRIVS